MTAPSIDHRIFVVGAPRSGTTLVQSLLAAHSRLTSFTESHFFSRHFKLLPGSSAAILTRNPVLRLREFLAENGVEFADVASQLSPPKLLLPLRTRSVARQFLAILDELACRQGNSGWVEKTPKHLRYLLFIEGLSGSHRPPRFVHVIRDGLETVASLFAASQNWEQPYDLETCVQRWNADVDFSLSRATALVGRPNDHFVFYEELTSRPEATLERLLSDLDLDWQPEILERYSSAPLITHEETWKVNVEGGIRRSGTSHRILTAEQRDQVHATLRPDLYARLLEQISR